MSEIRAATIYDALRDSIAAFAVDAGMGPAPYTHLSALPAKAAPPLSGKRMFVIDPLAHTRPLVFEYLDVANPTMYVKVTVSQPRTQSAETNADRLFHDAEKLRTLERKASWAGGAWPAGVELVEAGDAKFDFEDGLMTCSVSVSIRYRQSMAI